MIKSCTMKINFRIKILDLFKKINSLFSINKTIYSSDLFFFGQNKITRFFFILLLNTICFSNFSNAQIAQRGISNYQASSTGVSLQKPTGVVAGDLLIVSISVFDDYGVNIPTTPSGWTLIDKRYLNDGAKSAAIFYKIATASEGSSYSFPTSSPNCCGIRTIGQITAFSGVDVNNPFDVAPGTIAVGKVNTNAISAPSVTTVSSGAAVLFFGFEGYGAYRFSNWTTTSMGTLNEIIDQSQLWTTGCSVGLAWALKASPGATGTGSFNLSYMNSISGWGAMLLALKPACPLPTLSATTSISNITQCAAVSGGNVLTDGGCGGGITARGVCYGTTTGPTVSGTKTTDGTGTGVFTSNITGLSPATTYYVRSYATNSSGTTYGSEISFTTSSYATIYYSSSSGDLNNLSSWGSNSDGSGCNPINFTNAGISYIITNRTAATLVSTWTVSGAGSKVILGMASSPAVTFTIPNNYAFSGTIDIVAASSGSNTLVINNTSIPTFGTLHVTSTVNYNASNSQTISVATYGNLVTGVESGSTNFTKTAAGILDINGNLTIGNFSTLNLSTFSHTLAGHLIRSSGNSVLTAVSCTINFDGSTTQNINIVDPSAINPSPCDADITFGNVIINGSNVNLWYNKTTDRKFNIADLTVNTGKLLNIVTQ